MTRAVAGLWLGWGWDGPTLGGDPRSSSYRTSQMLLCGPHAVQPALVPTGTGAQAEEAARGGAAQGSLLLSSCRAGFFLAESLIVSLLPLNCLKVA